MRVMFLFNGTGGPDNAGIGELCRRPEYTQLFRTACAAVTAALDRCDPDSYRRYLPHGASVPAWLSGATRLSRSRRSSLIEGVRTHLYHLCLLSRWVARRPGGQQLVGAAGHSLGLYSAVVAARCLDDRGTFLDACAASLRLVTLTIVRSQQVYDALLGSRTPDHDAPMAAVVGIDRDQLQLMVKRYAERSTSPVQISVVNSAGFHVLGGMGPALEMFRTIHQAEFQRPGVRWFYLTSTAPFHSGLLAAAVDLLDRDRSFIGYDLTGSRLAVPVYITGRPDNLQHSSDLFRDVSHQSICRMFDWSAIVTRTVERARPDRLVDFGPGPAARVLTRTCLREAGYADLPCTAVQGY